MPHPSPQALDAMEKAAYAATKALVLAVEQTAGPRGLAAIMNGIRNSVGDVVTAYQDTPDFYDHYGDTH